MRILVVEDDIQLAEVLAEALNRRQYVVDIAKDGEAAWNSTQSMKYDLIVLDITLPKLDGIKFCHQLRTVGINNAAHRNATIPVLMLTARDTVADKIAGLDAGADDYVAKPFDLEELMARIRALLRRGSSSSTVSLLWEKLYLNPSTYEATYDGYPLSLTLKEYAILELLVANGRRVLSRSSIIEQVWSVDESPVEETIRSHIRCIRQKLKALGAAENFIETVHGLGYRLK
ncbi:response regulator transcription factor [Nostoc sp. FACHB-87]|uniref:response regulator transcription factor n=1 Tax=Nostocales TaxID=1161 RepID=UPI00168570D4|nr:MULTISPECIES: response regulator transcription factor [Nostocales]MBD2299729.1 response regulator transcription factor [Nostoc sp. FACHB-190]MBD2458093.1 response regulator transcription factor [Nostoc sp. FACHB-87]MBD2477607.1 response regulator transcription factor [Anabaena sp. FACHB-83]MBD2489636.1 response regulator transcription factor [Aulosira sp. FACHB-615]